MLIASVTKVYFHARPISDRKVHRNFRSMQLQQQQQQPSAMSVVNNYTAKLIGPLCLLAVWRDLGAEPESALNNEKLFASLFGDCHSSPGPVSGVISSPVTSHTGSWLVAPQTSDSGDIGGELFWRWGIGHMRQQLLRTRTWGPPLLQTRLWVPSVRFTKPPLEYFYIRYLVTWPGYAISSGGSSQKTE